MLVEFSINIYFYNLRRKLTRVNIFAYIFVVMKLIFTLGSSINFIAPTNLGSENSSTGIGGGPTPLACTLSPQNGWSPKKGTIVVGHYQKNTHIKNIIRRHDNITKQLISYSSFKPCSCCSSTPVMNLQKMGKTTRIIICK